MKALEDSLEGMEGPQDASDMLSEYLYDGPKEFARAYVRRLPEGERLTAPSSVVVQDLTGNP